MTYGEKIGLLIISASVFNVIINPDLRTVLWIIFLIGGGILLLSGNYEKTKKG